MSLVPVESNDRMVDALCMELSCLHCGSPLRTLNCGAVDGRVTNWVGECVGCRKQWVVTAEMVRVPRFGPDEGRVHRRQLNHHETA